MLNALQYYYFLILIISLSIFWKYIYLATYISKYLFLHFSYTISYTLTIPLHITYHNSSKLHSYTLLLKFYCFAAHKHVSISLILPYITHITNITSNKTSRSLPSPHFLRDAKHSYKSHYHGRHEPLLLKPFSWKAPKFYIKALLLHGTTNSYKIHSLRRHNYFLHKAFLLEGTYTPYKSPFCGRQLYS